MKLIGFKNLMRASSLALSAGLVLSGCGGKDDVTTGASLTTISGALQLASLKNNQLALADSGAVRYAPTTITSTWFVRCVTLAGTPQSGVGSVNPSTGAFSLSLLVAAGAAIGCFILDGTTIVATTVFKETTETMGGGSTKRAGSFVANSGTTGLEFGTIVVNTETGIAEVTTTNIVQTGGTAAASTWTDPTGAWNFAMYCDANLFATTAEYDACVTMIANDPQETSGTLYLKQYSAVDDGVNKYGIALWNSLDDLEACSGEGVDLPAGWTVAAGSEGLTATPNFAGLPAFSAVQASFAPCGSTASTCDGVTNVDNWGKPGGGNYTDAECKARCVAQNIWNYRPDGVCAARVGANNYGYTGALNYTVGAAFIGTGTGTGQFLMRFSENPQNRFAMGEATIGGTSASVMSYEEQDETVCFDRQNNGSCTSATCKVIRTDVITFNQVSASEMRVQVKGTETLEANSPAGCLDEDSHLFYWLGPDGKDEREFFVKMTK